MRLRQFSLVEKILLAVTFALGFTIASASVAGAQVESAPGDQILPFVSIDQWIVLCGLVIPFATALIKRYGAPDWISTIITAALSAIVAFTIEGLQAGDLTFNRWLNSAIVAFVTALVSWLATSDPVAWLNRKVPTGIGPAARVRTIEPAPVNPGVVVPDGHGGAA